MGTYGAALRAFEHTLEGLDIDAEKLADPAVQDRLGRRAALLVTSELTWAEHLGPLFDWSEVAAVLGTVGTRQGINDLAKRGRLLALPTKSGKLLYPAFQLAGGRILPGLPDVLAALGKSGASPWTQASWFVTPQPELDGATPALSLMRVGHDDAVMLSAQRAAARLAA